MCVHNSCGQTNYISEYLAGVHLLSRNTTETRFLDWTLSTHLKRFVLLQIIQNNRSITSTALSLRTGISQVYIIVYHRLIRIAKNTNNVHDQLFICGLFVTPKTTKYTTVKHLNAPFQNVSYLSTPPTEDEIIPNDRISTVFDGGEIPLEKTDFLFLVTANLSVVTERAEASWQQLSQIAWLSGERANRRWSRTRGCMLTLGRWTYQNVVKANQIDKKQVTITSWKQPQVSGDCWVLSTYLFPGFLTPKLETGTSGHRNYWPSKKKSDCMELVFSLDLFPQ